MASSLSTSSPQPQADESHGVLVMQRLSFSWRQLSHAESGKLEGGSWAVPSKIHLIVYCTNSPVMRPLPAMAIEKLHDLDTPVSDMHCKHTTRTSKNHGHARRATTSDKRGQDRTPISISNNSCHSPLRLLFTASPLYSNSISNRIRSIHRSICRLVGLTACVSNMLFH